jgi:gliding motility-associated-like protein
MNNLNKALPRILAKNIYKTLYVFAFLFLGLCRNIVFAQVPSISYTTPQVYTINTAIAPLMPANTGGAVPANAYGQVSTFAGSGIGNSVGYAPSASFAFPTGIATDNAGNFYVADYENNIIKKITNNVVSIFAGSGVQSSINGTGTAATFDLPVSVATDVAGNVYVAEISANLIRMITPAGVVTTFAGSGAPGSADGTGTAASFKSPSGIAVDNAGNVFVADRDNNLIRKITPTGVVTTFAGNGTTASINGIGLAASFYTPINLAFDNAGNLYVTEANGTIRKITPGAVVTTFASGFSYPNGIIVDKLGNVYVADQQTYKISKITPAGVITTLAGNGTKSFINGTIGSAGFSSLYQLAIDNLGNIYAADAFTNSVIRKISTTGYAIDNPLPAGLNFDGATGIISGTPTASSPATVYTITAYNEFGSSSTTINIKVNNVLQPSIITFPPPVAPQLDANNNFDPAATSTNKETPITYTSSNPAVAVITADGLVHIVGLGVSILTASQIGDANYTNAVPVTETLTVTSEQTINFTPIANKTTCDVDFSVPAYSNNNTIPLIYTSGNTTVATISSTGIIHIIGAGTTTITVSQAGSPLYLPATPVSQTLTVTAPIVPGIVISKYTGACDGMPVTFTATATNQGNNPTYQWQVNGVNVGTSQPTLSYVVVNTDVIKCTVTNNDSCPQSATASITGVNTTPYITPAISIKSSAGSPVCSGTNITFTATPVNEGISPVYQWRVNGINTGTNDPVFVSNTLLNNDKVTCVLTNTSSVCFTLNTATSNTVLASIVTIPDPAPSVTITASANNVYIGTSVSFTASSLYPVNNYQWQINGANVGANSPTFTTTNLKNGDNVTCTVRLTLACIAPITSESLIMNILASPTVRIPNTFTPNGDGINDLWDIPDLTFYPNCSVKIYNRYGKLLYYSKGYNVAWDGTYNSKMVPFSTYYYVINLDNSGNMLSGYVTIIR